MAGKRRTTEKTSLAGPSGQNKKPRQRRKNPEPTAHDQEQSFFFRLPLEIRDVIYRDILVSAVPIHLAYVGTKRRTFRSFPCQVSTGAGQVHPMPEAKQQARVLALLRSCRRIFHESVTVLYGENKFYIENPRTVLELPNYLTPARLGLIRHLYPESPWFADHTPPLPADRLQRWEEVINALEQLTGLTTLAVVLRPMWGLNWEVDRLRTPLERASLPALRITVDSVGKMPSGAPCARHLATFGV